MYTRAQLQEAGLLDFRVFLRQVWDYLQLPPPTAVQNDIAKNLQHGDNRLIICAFRGVGKSWITVAFVLWILLLDPQKKILVVSANEDTAKDFTKFCKQLIHGMDLLHHLAPKRGQLDSAFKFDVGPARASKDPSVKSAGITGQITGSRADLIVADDIEVPKNSYTHTLRERLAELVKEFGAILKPAGRIVYLGTPQIEQSLYTTRLLARGYVMMVWPLRIPDKVEAYGSRLAQYVHRLIARGAKAKDPVDPARFGPEEIEERLLEYGASGFALQFMLDTTPSDQDKHPLKLSDALCLDVDADIGHLKLVWAAEAEYALSSITCGGLDGDVWRRPAYRSDEMAKWTGTVMAIDPSGQGKDETAYAVVRNLSGVCYVVASGGFKDGYAESTLESLAAIAAQHGASKVIVERNYGGGMFAQMLKPHLHKLLPCDVEEVWHTGQKEERILDILEPLFKSHKIVFDRRVIEADALQQADEQKYSLIYQTTRMSRVKGALPNDDRVEALSMACGHWVERLGRDQDKAVDTAKKKLMEAELERFRQMALKLGARVGRKPARTLASGRMR